MPALRATCPPCSPIGVLQAKQEEEQRRLAEEAKRKEELRMKREQEAAQRRWARGEAGRLESGRFVLILMQVGCLLGRQAWCIPSPCCNCFVPQQGYHPLLHAPLQERAGGG